MHPIIMEALGAERISEMGERASPGPGLLRLPRQAPIPGEWSACLGSAKLIACDGPEGRPRHGGRERDNETAEENGTVQHRSRGPDEPSRSAAG
jgi:hypothetical protein